MTVKKGKAKAPAKPATRNSGRNTQEKPAAQFPIVGIGASAGGLEAFEQFFRHIPTNTGMAFVLVSHLDPDHASMLTEILQRTTSMPVTEALDQAQAVSYTHLTLPTIYSV